MCVVLAQSTLVYLLEAGRPPAEAIDAETVLLCPRKF